MCGSTLTKKNGHRRRTLRDLGGVRTVSVQRHICLERRHGYSEELPEIAPHDWYTRRVKRTFLDMYTTIGGSLRRCAGWITAEITNRGRTFIWDPLAHASGLCEFLARCLYGVRPQRCVFHLWRNVLPIITRYAAVAGEQWAEGLKKCIACVWNATTQAEAELMLKLLVGVYGAEQIAQEVVRLVQGTFEQAMTHHQRHTAKVGNTR